MNSLEGKESQSDPNIKPAWNLHTQSGMQKEQENKAPGVVPRNQRHAILVLSPCSQEFHRRGVCPQSLSISSQSRLGYQLRLRLLCRAEKRPQVGFHWPKYGLFPDSTGNPASRGLGASMHSYMLHDSWQVPPSAGLFLLLQREICIWAPFGLLQTSLSGTQRLPCTFLAGSRP